MRNYADERRFYVRKLVKNQKNFPSFDRFKKRFKVKTIPVRLGNK